MPVVNVSEKKRSKEDIIEIKPIRVKLNREEKEDLKKLLKLKEETRKALSMPVKAFDSLEISVELFSAEFEYAIFPFNVDEIPYEQTIVLSEMAKIKGSDVKDPKDLMIMELWNNMVYRYGEFTDVDELDMVSKKGRPLYEEFKNRTAAMAHLCKQFSNFFARIEKDNDLQGLSSIIRNLNLYEYENLIKGLSKGHELLVS